MRNLYNTSFEVSLRVLLLLDKSNRAINVDTLTYLDFISVYAKDFAVSEFNVNGENRYKHGELSAKRRMINSALKRLVLDRFVKVTVSDSGMLYGINELGKEYVKQLDSEYAIEYSHAAEQVIKKYGHLSDKELVQILNENAVNERKA